MTSPSGPTLSNFIGGAFRTSASTAILEHRNPSDRAEVVASVPAGSTADVRAATSAAAEALPGWRALTGGARAEVLYRWASVIDGRREEMAQLLVREGGKPVSEARGEVNRCVVVLRYYAGEAVRSIGEVVPAGRAGSLQFTLRDPLGVVALITPWNFPVAIPLWKAGPALAFGNTVVLKPSEMASASGSFLAETAAAADVPEGVFNVVLGSGAEAGSALVRDDLIHGISFTGSARTGGLVGAVAAERGLPFQAEMGGKNVVIVCEDADLDLAAKLTAGGAMRFAGQKCTATSRAVVHERVEAAFLDRLTREIEALPLGPVTDTACAVGPLISATAHAAVTAAVEEAPGERVMGGVLPEGAGFEEGCYFPPTVLRDVPAESRVARDELFGPVLATFTVPDMDEALRLANHTQYGLSASLFTRDIDTALRYIREIEVGLVRVNGDTTGVDPHAPFGGMKSSSTGAREQGRAAREFYTEIKTVQINPAG